MVLPGMESSWAENKPKWFVMDDTNIDQLREPGKSLFCLEKFTDYLFILFRFAQSRIFNEIWFWDISFAQMLFDG